MASPNLSELVTTTIRNRSRKLADNVSKNNALLSRLMAGTASVPFSGGTNIMQELEYAENGSFTRYSGYDTLNISPSDVFSAAEFDIKQASVAVTVSGLEELKNSGKEKQIELVTSRVQNAERTMKNNLSSDIYSTGTADGGKQIGGLQLLVADDPSTGTVGGIDRANFSFWQNQVVDFSTDIGAAASATTIQAAMNRAYLATSRGGDHVDLILADDNYYTFYWESLQAIQRITDTSKGVAGFDSLRFKGADVVYDGGLDGTAPADHMYFLNTDYIHWRVHTDRNFVPMDDRFSTNQDAVVKLILWAGNLTISNPSLQCVLKD